VKLKRYSKKAPSSNTYALKPDDFFGTLPKLLKKKVRKLKQVSPFFLARTILE